MKDGILSGDDFLGFGVSLCSGLRNWTLDRCRRILRLVIPNGSSSSSSFSSLLSRDGPALTGVTRGRCVLGLGLGLSLELEAATAALGVPSGHVVERDVAEESSVRRAGLDIKLREGVDGSASLSSVVSSSILGSRRFFTDENRCCGSRGLGGLDRFDWKPAAALVVAVPAALVEIHFASFLGLSIKPCKPVGTRGISLLWLPFCSTFCCFAI